MLKALMHKANYWLLFVLLVVSLALATIGTNSHFFAETAPTAVIACETTGSGNNCSG